MSDTPDGLWLCTNPQLRRFDQQLFKRLNQQADIRCWSYVQTADEPCCFETAVALLHDYLQDQSRPIHLIGHSLSGVVGLLYARRYPAQVKSLTLLSVGAKPAAGWHTHYYALRHFLPCSRAMVLHQMVRLLFGPQSPGKTAGIAKLLAQVLDTELAPHSLGHRSAISEGGIEPPLLVCHGANDVIMDANAKLLWKQWLKSSDRLWSCPEGRHFFHYEYPQRSSQMILDFWQQMTYRSNLSLVELTR
ncbi:MAG: alpha/beta hydrolase [Leptolyngbya sp. SIO1D8]|nr:alpha/beta hydrolase [Leptolyngbya sp. SIO1D8]